MKTLHQALMGFTLAAVLVVTLGMIQPWTLVAEAQHVGTAQAHQEHTAAQHGHTGAPQHDAVSMEEHFHQFAAELELSEEQMHAVAGSFQEAHAAMQQFHSAHAAIAEQLSETQQQKLAEMLHHMIGEAFAGERHGQ